MLGKAILASIVFLLAIVGGTLGWEHLRGRYRLGKVLEDLKQRGETLDMARLLPPEVPQASNGLAALMLASENLMDAGDVAPPAFNRIAPARAMPATRLETWHDGRTSRSWSDVETWIERHASDLDELRAAADKPFRRATLDVELGFKTPIKHLAPFKNAILALNLAALDSARRGDFDAALADLRAGRILEDDLATEPLLITQLVRIAGTSIAASRGWHVLHAADWSADQLAALQEIFAPPDLIGPTVRSLEGERAFALPQLRTGPTADLVEAEAISENLNLIFSGGPQAPKLRVPTSLDDAVELAGEWFSGLGAFFNARVWFPLWRFGWGDQAIVQYLNALDQVLRVQREAVTQKSASHLETLDLVGLIEPKTAMARLRSRYARMSLPTLAYAARKAFRAETERALIHTGVAIRRFQLRHQRLPEALTELVPDFLPEPPLDRMDGRPLRYRRDTANEFTLWSVGDNLKDDGGDPTRPGKESASLHWWQGRDAVWPQPATEEQIATWKAAEEKRHAAGASAPALNAEIARRYGIELPAPPGSTPTNPPTSARDPEP